MIESTGARENERGRVQNDVVTHPVRVGVRNKAVIGLTESSTMYTGFVLYT